MDCVSYIFSVHAVFLHISKQFAQKKKNIIYFVVRFQFEKVNFVSIFVCLVCCWMNVEECDEDKELK